MVVAPVVLGRGGHPAPGVRPPAIHHLVGSREYTRPMMAQSMSSNEDAQNEDIEAHCTACGDVHPLGDRRMGWTTTICPHCGDTSYKSVCDADPITKSHSDRIHDAIVDVRGVGDQTRDNILDAYETYYTFEAADERELRSIDGVGKQTAKRIKENQ